MRMLATSRRNTAADPLDDRLIVSLTLAPTNCMTSRLPLPPSTASLPSPGVHTKESLPLSSDTVSLPRPASTWSSPLPPKIVSLPSPVLMMSLPFPPSTVNGLSVRTPGDSANWSSPFPSVTEMASKSVRLKCNVLAASLPNATCACVASALSMTASGPLLPVITNVLPAMVAEPAFGTAAADATSAGPVETSPTANAAAAAIPSGRARPRLSFCMGEIPPAHLVPTDCRLDSQGDTSAPPNGISKRLSRGSDDASKMHRDVARTAFRDRVGVHRHAGRRQRQPGRSDPDAEQPSGRAAERRARHRHHDDSRKDPRRRRGHCHRAR